MKKVKLENSLVEVREDIKEEGYISTTKSSYDSVLEKKATEVLNKLGKSPSTIAKKLKKLNCIGVKKSWHSCPLAKLMLKQFNCDPVVEWDLLTLFEKGNKSNCITQVSLSPPLSKFTEEFDKGKYPELEDTHNPISYLV